MMSAAKVGAELILLKKLSDRYSPFFLTALQAFAGVVLFFLMLCRSEQSTAFLELMVAMIIAGVLVCELGNKFLTNPFADDR
ncbi:hypothetical protein [Pelagibius sp. Alg239-R121]|uniref:hypothetical protein n=1 Tax=Pelagibius sp. Alg239-R121 TaxID=2993448 RepID=UPI0024A70B96|nr:hypothetical protein [Pelagibius sp. Alg239-R121]